MYSGVFQCFSRGSLYDVVCGKNDDMFHALVTGSGGETNRKKKLVSRFKIQYNVDYPKRQISEPTFSSFYVQTTKNRRLLHAVKYCVVSIKYCILYVLYCTAL